MPTVVLQRADTYKEKTIRPFNTDVAVDVVIIGGGLHGLVVLDSVIRASYSCALVTQAEISAGQTLHSHGFLNTGSGLVGDELTTAARDIVHPYQWRDADERVVHWRIA